MVVGFRVFRAAGGKLGPPNPERYLQRVRDAPGYLVLQREHVGKLPIVRLRTETIVSSPWLIWVRPR